jgi:uncharacterized membrane protein (DUF485 family)
MQEQQQYDWGAILKNADFMHLQRKKSSFLFGLWTVGVIPYFLLIISAGYFPELLRIKVLGRMNIGYLFCLSQFFLTIALGVYYIRRTGRDFDPLTKKLIENIQEGGA